MIRLYTADEAETRRKIARVAKMYGIKPRIERSTGKRMTNISATIEAALDAVLAARQTAGERELAREKEMEK